MSSIEQGNAAPAEGGRGSFKLVRNAKGETQFEVKVYALGDEEQDEVAARERAVVHFDALFQRYPI